jgi:hypothetical protein
MTMVMPWVRFKRWKMLDTDATSGAEALEVLRREAAAGYPFDIVVVDCPEQRQIEPRLERCHGLIRLMLKVRLMLFTQLLLYLEPRLENF